MAAYMHFNVDNASRQVCAHGPLLLPRSDVKADGVAGEIETNVVFVAWLDGTPCGEVCAGRLIQFVFLASLPIRRYQDLKARDQIAESGLSSGRGSLLPIANELRSWVYRKRNFNCADHTILRPTKFQRARIRVGSMEAFKNTRASLKRFLQALAEIIATPARRGWSRLGRRERSVMHQKRRGERVHHQVELSGSVTLLRHLQMERALADIRSLRGCNFTIGWTCVDVMVDTRRINGEVPRRVEALERIHCSRVPVRAVCKGDLRVTDTHRHVVSPCRHLAGDFCIFRRDLGNGGCMRPVPSKVDHGCIEYFLHT